MAGNSRTVDFNNAELKNSWQEVRNDRSNTNWILVTQRDGETVVSTGDDGLAGMKNSLTETDSFFGVVRVRAVDEHGSKRAKFVYVTYVGSGVSPIRRARVTALKSDFERFFNGCHVNIYATSEDSLSEKAITDLLDKCAGAHKPEAYEFS